MKTKLTTILLAVVTSLVLFSATANAAEKKWEYPLGANRPVATTPDGTGGIAFVIPGQSGDYAVVWLDSKGKQLYKRDAGDNQIEIVAANAHVLVLNIQNAGGTSIYEIDRKGKETITKEPGVDFLTIFNGATGPASVSDHSGFFIHHARADGFFLVRYSFD